MRSFKRQQQKVWFTRVTEKNVGIDKVKVYAKPFMKELPVSATSGTPEEIAAGVVPNYDRYITSYKKLDVQEGDMCFVDVEPQLDASGELAMKEDSIPVTPPDYRIVKLLVTQKGLVFRYGIVKIGGNV
ncbi:hypothetical protein B5F53_11845 [Blautia sp. An249]|uniref:hypothetical protein n=1 Tax=Blautia sp. An249 TaxID=1965603 RepID=UPI000B37A226|nr:hypothetical protein [Blautia sp. An249]OUO77901.1 hypothetical protein B5F53_11845 [Blautia sp. An249]